MLPDGNTIASMSKLLFGVFGYVLCRVPFGDPDFTSTLKQRTPLHANRSHLHAEDTDLKTSYPLCSKSAQTSNSLIAPLEDDAMGTSCGDCQLFN